ncbi:MAG: protein phosphatase 2C domain-containing protein [Vallitaleaceae bacterium]|jgi:serine/threonine protein phosphatase PrpC|nr:protein phosphatase 2C domain-containing protein [Vallitaleaceae bacterium]
MTIDSITDTYKTHNEDIYGATEHSFWILDGALPLSHANYTDETSDVVWMVKWWNHYLSQNIEQLDKSIITILEEGISQLNIAFARYADISQLSKLDRASATIAIVRMSGEVLETYVLGDSEIVIQTNDGHTQTIIDETIEELDLQVINMIFNNQERLKAITFSGYTDEELKVLRDNRMKMNSKGGYYILEHDIEAINNGIYKEYALSSILDILLMSDGYSAIYNKYRQLTIKQLMDTCKNEGLEKVLGRIRKLEDDDVDFTKHKRLRIHDDATAILISI